MVSDIVRIATPNSNETLLTVNFAVIHTG